MSVVQELTAAEAGLTTAEQTRIALTAIAESGGTASMDQIYQAVEARLGGARLSAQGRATLRWVVNYRAVKCGYVHPHDAEHPGWRITATGREVLFPSGPAPTFPLDIRLVIELRQLREELLEEGKLVPWPRLEAYHENFRRRFGPEILKGLDGGALLEKLHGGPPDSLGYWLEFKNDEELPAFFGSIAGGSALKFGIFRRRETGIWQKRGAQNYPTDITVDEAVEIARRQRDELVRGCELLEALAEGAEDAECRRLQEQMDARAPEVSRLAWGHKYFSLLYPGKLDDYHVPHYQRFHLIKLLQEPPEDDGRYLCAGRFVSAARQLDMPIGHLTAVLNRRNGPPHTYWKIGTSDSRTPRNRWPLMRDGQFVAIGWERLGDLSDCRGKDGPELLKQRLLTTYYHDKPPQVAGNQAQQVHRFLTAMKEGDLVLACDGAAVLGVGRITGDYAFIPEADFPNRRAVEWLSLEEWKQPEPEARRMTVYALKHARNMVAAERQILDHPPVARDRKTSPERRAVPRLSGISGRIQAVLERKGQVILYGPPGTGKTYWAEKTACDLAAHATFGVPFDELEPEQRQTILGPESTGDGLVRLCCFHPAYGYEDFLQGYRPETLNGSICFPLRDGIFKSLCADAHSRPNDHFFLIIDEINRGDIPRIFGELMTVLEKTKRGKYVALPLGGTRLCVPPNVHIIGTMNTADRSIALLDTALRRRFSFIELMPDSSILGSAVVGGIPLGPWLDALNQRVCAHVGRDARNLQIGHTYLLEQGEPVAEFSRFCCILREEIVPLLEEYCYEDYSALAKILGSVLVDEDRQAIQEDLFHPEREQDLVQALLAPCSEIAASFQAIAAEDRWDEEETDQIETDALEVADDAA